MLSIFRIGLIFVFILSLNIPAFAFENHIYIWQKSWNQPIKNAVHEINPLVEGFTILSGHLNYQKGKFSVSPVDVNWSYFDSKSKNVILALRIHSAASKLFKSESMQEAINQMGDLLNKAKQRAEASGVKVIGVQFDYDCPTSKLNDYARFLSLFKQTHSNLSVSITALPTWLNTGNFKTLIRETVFYVLQLHVFERPKSISEAKKIFLVDEAMDDVKQADTLNHPYFVSLPTYGYEVAFDKKGQFIGLKAENAPILWAKDAEVQTVITQPQQILSFVQLLKDRNSTFMKGVYWFRLPLVTDEYNWPMSALKAVIENRAPVMRLEIEIREVNPGLSEVYLMNNGENNLNGTIDATIQWSQDQELIYDIVGSFKKKVVDQHSLLIEGPAPRVQTEILIGWLRNRKANEAVILKTNGVNIHETK